MFLSDANLNPRQQAKGLNDQIHSKKWWGMSVSKEAKTNYKSDQDIRGIERRTHRPSNKTAGDQRQVTVNVCWAIYDPPFFWSTWLRTDFRAALHADAETWQEGRYGGLARGFNIFRDLLFTPEWEWLWWWSVCFRHSASNRGRCGGFILWWGNMSVATKLQVFI